MAGIIAPQRPRTTIVPTGKPNPPIVLLAGGEKTGKSYEAALGSASELIGRTLWIEFGESTAHYYGGVPGARYEIVPHDGSYQDLLDAIRFAVAQPRGDDGRPNMIVIDSVTALWDLLGDEQALFARRRANNRAAKNKQAAPGLDDPVTIDHDLWNRAKDRWGEVLWLLRRHDGPVILCARLEEVTAFENDRPTRNSVWKVKAEKNLPAVVDAIVQLRGLGQAHLTGVRSLRLPYRPDENRRYANFSIDKLLRDLGLQEAAVSRSQTEIRPDAYIEEYAQEAEKQRAAEPEAPRSQDRPVLTSDEAANLIRSALTDSADPKDALLALRERFGTLLLGQVKTNTKWGIMSANSLISRSLNHLSERASQATPSVPAPPGPEAGQSGASVSEPSDPPELSEEAPLSDEEVPADPQADIRDDPDDADSVPAGEEPQIVQPATPPPPKRIRNQDKAMAALLAEADLQARVLSLPLQEHLAPLIKEGAGPESIEVFDLYAFAKAAKSDVVGVLIKSGDMKTANAYTNAPFPDPNVAVVFAECAMLAA
ncbi:hypothetical protein G3I60_05400 [Streptomyces sp. SID13666]|uniref:AAA family ATPase n=1 Tax=Streptomyces sp. SID13666 TaxID=2706054 RepID=UPI0013BF4579|nr:AAA family ATPase [Streptomyces sp. SID13666]NEA53607.1 hypothetical protein [Streptomyces sp. SID13666]